MPLLPSTLISCSWFEEEQFLVRHRPRQFQQLLGLFRLFERPVAMVRVFLAESWNLVLVPEVSVWPVSCSGTVVEDVALLLELLRRCEGSWRVACV